LHAAGLRVEVRDCDQRQPVPAIEAISRAKVAKIKLGEFRLHVGNKAGRVFGTTPGERCWRSRAMICINAY